MINHYKYSATYIDKRGCRHKTNGPAILYFDGRWVWCLNGLAHRYYGPACLWDNPNGVWRLHGKPI